MQPKFILCFTAFLVFTSSMNTVQARKMRIDAPTTPTTSTTATPSTTEATTTRTGINADPNTEVSTINTSMPVAGRQDCSKRSCEFGWLNFGVKCLKLYNVPKTFAQAYNICRDDDQGRLLTLTTPEQQNDAEKLFMNALGGAAGQWLYLGAVRSPHTGFFWLGDNGTQLPMNYTNWYLNQPDSLDGTGTEACTAFHLNRELGYGKWHDINCDLATAFICEKYL